MFPDPVFWREGEEFSFNVGGYNITEVRNFTKTGEVCCIKMGGKNMIVKVTFFLIILLTLSYHLFAMFMK